MKTVLCYGDSNTYGYNPENGERYPKSIRWTTILQELLGNEYEVVSEGLNGRTTAYDRPDNGEYKNGFTPFKAIFGSNKPIDYLIIMLGTNDCNKELNLSVFDIAKGLEKLVTSAIDYSFHFQEYVPKIVVVAPASIADTYKTSPFSDQLDEEAMLKSIQIVPLYKELATKYNCLFLDNSKGEVSPIDSEHLTINGHKELAQRLAELIGYN